jgi:uncharacterized membrane-anchored protein
VQRQPALYTNKQREQTMVWTVSMRGLLLALISALFSCFAAAAPNEGDTQKIFDEAKQASTTGPKDVALTGQATLHLPAGLAFVPQPHAQRVLHAMGNPGSDSGLQGLVFPAGDGGWFAVVRYEAAGYIKDDDARDWNADDLLKSFRDGTEASNEERKKMGVPELQIVGWAEKPAYDATAHRLVWAMASRHKGEPESAEQGVNYNTYALGREGYFSINLVTGLKALPAHKPAAASLLGALDYSEGKRYADFNASTDKVAEYGLAALVLGVGAKKLGLFAVIAAFAAKFAKIAILGAVAFGGAIFKFFKRGKSTTE